MPQRISIDGEIHEFPDDFTDADIAKALGGAKASPSSSLADAAMNAAGTGLVAAAPGLITRGVEQLATHPLFSKLVGAAESKATAPLIGGAEVVQMLRGRKDPVTAAKDAAGNYAATRVPGILQRLALKYAPSVGSAMDTVSGVVNPLATSAMLYQLLNAKVLDGKSATDAQAERMAQNSALQNALEHGMK